MLTLVDDTFLVNLDKVFSIVIDDKENALTFKSCCGPHKASLKVDVRMWIAKNCKAGWRPITKCLYVNLNQVVMITREEKELNFIHFGEREAIEYKDEETALYQLRAFELYR